MTAKFSIKDGQNNNTEACVKPVGTLSPKEHALCVNISGTSPGQSVTISESAAGGQTDVYLTLEVAGVPDGVTRDSSVDGSVTTQRFSVYAYPEKDFIITDVIVLGLDTAIKLNNFLGQNTGLALNTGCVLTIKANDELTVFEEFTQTFDLAAFSSISGFDLLSEQGGDMAKAIRQFTPLLVLRAQDSFGTLPGDDDFISWDVRANLTSITELIVQLRGFLVDPGTV